MSITPRQLEVLDFIVDFVREHRYAPTLREMADHFDLSRVTVLQHVEALEEAGYLDRQPHKARGITVKKTARLVADPGDSMNPDKAGGEVHEAGPDTEYGSASSETSTVTPPTSHALPLLGNLTPGESMEAIEQTKTISANDVFCDPDDCYLLRIKGKGLHKENIQNGDLLIINEHAEVQNGDLVLISTKSDPPSLRRYSSRNDVAHLDPIHPDLDPLTEQPDDVQISGKVVGLIRFPSSR